MNVRPGDPRGLIFLLLLSIIEHMRNNKSEVIHSSAADHCPTLHSTTPMGQRPPSAMPLSETAMSAAMHHAFLY